MVLVKPNNKFLKLNVTLAAAMCFRLPVNLKISKGMDHRDLRRRNDAWVLKYAILLLVVIKIHPQYSCRERGN